MQNRFKKSIKLMLSCLFFCQPAFALEITKVQWGNVEAEPVWLYTLENKNGMKVKVTNWGAYTVAIETEDKHGSFADVILGYDTFEQYFNDCCYNGAVVGRYANRIAKGRFSLNNEDYQLTTNNGGSGKINHSHGGKVGFNKRLWHSRVVNNTIEMTYNSPDGEQGYPGNLTAQLIYQLSENNELSLTFMAISDKATPINLISHAYYNLSGTVNDIESHVLQINADKITEVGEYLIPTGRFIDVKDTPFNFNQAKEISKDIRKVHPQLKLAGGQDKDFGGFDHNWVLTQEADSDKPNAELYEPISGRLMQVYTTQPGLHVYTGNFMNGSVIGKAGKKMTFRSGVAIETQHFPDSPNNNNFPSTILQPDQTYIEQTVYKFSYE
ncbi:MAG: aldose 1-epimerase [Colwellia sp.]|jgi:aldose 1-epimerase